MKRGIILLLAAVMILGLSVQAHATLTLLGTGTITSDVGGDGSGVGGNYQLIYDSGLNITWLDYSAAYTDWQGQVNWASNLTVSFDGNNIKGWRLPTTVDAVESGNWYDGTGTYGYNITKPGDEMSYLYYVELGNKGYVATNGSSPQPGYGLVNKGPFENLLNNAYYWSGTEYSATPVNAWYFHTWDGFQTVIDKGFVNYGGLAVLPGDPAAPASVPEPNTILLLGIGLAGLAGWKKLARRRGEFDHLNY